MKRIMLLSAALLVPMFACTDEERTVSVLRKSGYHQITLTGYDWFACGKGDTYCTGFTARTGTGDIVKGAVGCGYGCGKGCTIRFE